MNLDLYVSGAQWDTPWDNPVRCPFATCVHNPPRHRGDDYQQIVAHLRMHLEQASRDARDHFIIQELPELT